MSMADDVRNDRIAWLTKAVRGLLKMEFDGETPGLAPYSEMAVGKEDAALRVREEAIARAVAAVDSFMNEPSNEEAVKKLEKMFPPAPEDKA